jgi:hypothetical protein
MIVLYKEFSFPNAYFVFEILHKFNFLNKNKNTYFQIKTK